MLNLLIGVVFQLPWIAAFAILWPVFWSADKLNSILRYWGVNRQRRSRVADISIAVGATLTAVAWLGFVLRAAFGDASSANVPAVLTWQIDIPMSLWSGTMAIIQGLLSLGIGMLIFLHRVSWWLIAIWQQAPLHLMAYTAATMYQWSQ